MSAPRHAPAVVIGGGVIGLATGYHLARAGIPAVVLDRDPVPSQASVRNAGGLRAQCRNRVERLLALRSIQLWRQLVDETGYDIEYVAAGNLRVALTPSTLDALEAEGVEEAGDGLRTEMWDTAELRRRAPHLSQHFAGAKHCATDGHANPILATWMLADAAERAGAVLLRGATATAVDVEGGTVTAVRGVIDGEPFRMATSTVIHAAGPWTPELAESIGVHVPLRPARNAILVTQAAPPLFDEFVSSHELKVYVRQARKGQVHIGGVFTVEDTFDQTVTTAELEHLARATRIVPAIGEFNVLRAWAGTLDLTPDHLPVVGQPAGISGYLVAAGFSGHGFCLGPVVGRVLSELVTGVTPCVDVTSLHPDRFAQAERSTA